MTKAQLADLLTLPIKDRVAVAEALWRSIEEEPVPGWQKRLLDERLRNADANPEDVVSWEAIEGEVMAELEHRRAS